VQRHPGYPFIPRTGAYIRPGDFWAVPLRRGGWYACGRVLDTQTGLGNRLVTVGLLDWCEADEPTSDAIAGVRVLEYGIEHVRFRRVDPEWLAAMPLESLRYMNWPPRTSGPPCGVAACGNCNWMVLEGCGR